MRKDFTKDEWIVKQHGIEVAKQMNDYYNDLERRFEIGKKKAIENLPRLFEEINKKTGLNLTFTFELKNEDDFDRARIEIKSNDFASQFQVISNAWESMVVTNFSSGFYNEKNEQGYYNSERDYSKPCPNVSASMVIQYSYVHLDGGRNGATIGYARTSEKTNWEWTYETETESRK